MFKITHISAITEVSPTSLENSHIVINISNIFISILLLVITAIFNH